VVYAPADSKRILAIDNVQKLSVSGWLAPQAADTSKTVVKREEALDEYLRVKFQEPEGGDEDEVAQLRSVLAAVKSELKLGQMQLLGIAQGSLTRSEAKACEYEFSWGSSANDKQVVIERTHAHPPPDPAVRSADPDSKPCLPSDDPLKVEFAMRIARHPADQRVPHAMGCEYHVRTGLMQVKFQAVTQGADGRARKKLKLGSPE